MCSHPGNPDEMTKGHSAERKARVMRGLDDPTAGILQVDPGTLLILYGDPDRENTGKSGVPLRASRYYSGSFFFQSFRKSPCCRKVPFIGPPFVDPTEDTENRIRVPAGAGEFPHNPEPFPCQFFPEWFME